MPTAEYPAPLYAENIAKTSVETERILLTNCACPILRVELCFSLQLASSAGLLILRRVSSPLMDIH
jgi:hypothetical protein